MKTSRTDLTRLICNLELEPLVSIGKPMAPVLNQYEFCSEYISENEDGFAVYHLTLNFVAYEITTHFSKICGISVLINEIGEITPQFFLSINSETFDLSAGKSLDDFLMFLSKNNILWEFDKFETYSKRVCIRINNDSKLIYSFYENEFGFQRLISWKVIE